MGEVTLKEHIESQIAWIDRYFEAKLEWMDRHVDGQVRMIDSNTAKAASSIDKRLEGMNEFRDSLKDQASRFVTRQESAAKHEAIETRLKSIELSRATGEGRMLMISGFVAFVASILVSIIAHWFNK